MDVCSMHMFTYVHINLNIILNNAVSIKVFVGSGSFSRTPLVGLAFCLTLRGVGLFVTLGSYW